VTTEVRIPEAHLARFECHTHRGIHTVERLREAGVPVVGVLAPLGVERGVLSVETDDLATGDTVWRWSE
jgi:hypothetical protein